MDKYEVILNEVSRKPSGTFAIYEPDYEPNFMKNPEKFIFVDKPQTFQIELTDKATEKDKKEYINFVLDYVGLDYSSFFVSDDDFDPDQEDDYE